jgi:hypothetical protein
MASQAFNACIEGSSFQDAVKAWAACSRGLKQAIRGMLVKPVEIFQEMSLFAEIYS